MKYEGKRISVYDESECRVLDLLCSENGVFIETKTKQGKKSVPLDQILNLIKQSKRINADS